jgi:hypothetical protein
MKWMVLQASRSRYAATYLGLPRQKVSEEVERVVRFDTGIHALRNRLVHFMRIGERALAETNDVGVPQMKIGREPDVSHHLDYAKVA